MSFMAELKQRKVFRVAVTYAVVAWLLIQVSATVGPALKLPDWTVTFVTVLVALGFPVALVLAWTFDIVRPGRNAGGAAGAAAGAPSGIAVLPFANMTGEATQGHLADGIVEDLLTRLQAAGRTGVVSRQSSQAYKDRGVDARTIARELGCRYVVEGSVRKLGDRVRVNVQLIDAPTDRHLWAERYERRLEDAFQLQDEICDEIVVAIESRIASEAAGVPALATGTPGPAARVRQALSGRWTIPALLALVAMAALLTWTLQRQAQERSTREEALPRLQALIAQDDYEAAFDLAREIERVTPNDPLLRSLEPAFSAPVRLNTAPEGARVSYRPYAGNDQDWRPLGVTPLVDVDVPLGAGLWRIEKEGYETALLVIRNPGLQLGNDPNADFQLLAEGMDFTIGLADSASSPAGMVFVPDIPAMVPYVSDGDLVRVPAFFLDRLETTNRQFKEFVDASGYAEAAYWQGLPFDAASGGWPAAARQFVDLTGRPGPASWQAGTYVDGTGDHPVSGISWYEAAAYCRFRGKELPTAAHWYRAASSIVEMWESLASVIVHASNFSGRGLEPAGRLESLGPYGTRDMAGNVREWLWTAGSAGRWIAGGAFNEPQYIYSQSDEAPPADRSVANGVRCMRTLQGGPVPEDLRQPIVKTTVDYAALTPVGDDAYAVLAQQLDYGARAFTPRVEDLPSSNPAWTRQRVLLPTGYDKATFAVQLFLPAGRKPPFQVVFYMPHSGEFFAPVTTDTFDPAQGGIPLDFLVKSGRALAVIAFDNAFERQWSTERRQSMALADRTRMHLRHWREELGRTIDYLATRQDIDAERLGWFGVSFGSDAMVPPLAVERRIGAAVLYSGGMFQYSALPAGEQPFNYYPRVTQPVLMLNGRWDIDSPPESQKRMLALLGAPGDRKQRIEFEAGHGNLPRFKVEQATLEWFDRHLGAVPH